MIQSSTPQFASCNYNDNTITNGNSNGCGNGSVKPYGKPKPIHTKHDSKISVDADSISNTNCNLPDCAEQIKLHSPNTNTRSSVERRCRHSRTSIASSKSHKEYIDSLEMPSKETIEHIKHVQEEKEIEAIKKKLTNGSEDERKTAAELIQRNYRGHRERRILEGKRLDAGTRWAEALKEARYRNLTAPRARDSGSLDIQSPTDGDAEGSHSHAHARENWKKIAAIARRAGWDEESGEESGDDIEGLSEEQREERRKKRITERQERQKAAKIMDLQYFLEMVDLKHRYGSNLRTYHGEWKKSDTNENFFYWLDYGEGRFIDCQGCPRERLDREQVRYLSKEERLDYLVKVDSEGRLCWAKNGKRIDTTTEYKDSIHGIVPISDEATPFTPVANEAATNRISTSSSSSSSESITSPVSPHTHSHHHPSHPTEQEAEDSRASKYATPELDNGHPMKRVTGVSPSTIFNKLLRGSVKKNTWIFVADTSFRLYVGIKQSGAFQHSSFLHGSRISAAGTIKVKDGKLKKLSPLSGHYRPPVDNFRQFVKALKKNGVDMRGVSISRSFAVLVGLEAYVKTRRKVKKVVGKVKGGGTKVIDREKALQKREEERDLSQSAERERMVLEEEKRRKEEEKLVRRLVGESKAKVLTKLDRGGKGETNGLGEEQVLKKTKAEAEAEVDGIPAPASLGDGEVLEKSEGKGKGKQSEKEDQKEEEWDAIRELPGQGPENGIPPEGKRDE